MSSYYCVNTNQFQDHNRVLLEIVNMMAFNNCIDTQNYQVAPIFIEI
jgi:hypothetical protein